MGFRFGTRKAKCSAGLRRNVCGGFTLVEALVVAVIMGTLAAVAVPTYINYLRNQKLAAAKGIAQSGAVAANIFYRRNGIAPTNSSQLNLFLSDSSRYTVTISGNYVVVTDISSTPNLADSAKFK